MFWLWGGTGSCGLKFTATGLTLDGAESGYIFSALYLNFNTYHYCYGSWSDTDTKLHFKVTRDSALPEPRSRMMMELHLMLMISISS